MIRLRRIAGRLWSPVPVVGRTLSAVLVPESSEEAVVEVGLVLLAAGFVAAGLVPLALAVPGALLVAIGLGFNLRRR